MPKSMHKSRLHAMTCDVEDYFHVSAFEKIMPHSRWSELECRIPRNIERALELLELKDVKATFFTLGWVAEHYPALLRRVSDQGHEIASHGMRHTRVWAQDSNDFFEDASDSRKLLEDITGVQVVGYRAASWSIDDRTPWAHDMLAEAGYKYSSSVYPIKHDHFGMPSSPRFPYSVANGNLLEIPASTARVFGRNVPAAGGGYFRLYPLRFSKYLIQQQHDSASHPYVFYFHPWELDPEQPRVRNASIKSQFRHYLNLRRFESRLAAILDDFQWGRMDEIFLGET